MATIPFTSIYQRFSTLFGILRTHFDPLEVCLLLGSIGAIIPGTWISRLLEYAFWLLLNNLGISRQMSPLPFYVVGFLLLACLLSLYIHARFVLRCFPVILFQFADAMCLFASLFLLDFFFSTANPFAFEDCWWPFFTLVPFFIVMLYLSGSQAVRLMKCIAFLTGIQAAYAIFYYLTNQHQFHTPHFGNRTSGTFNNPNPLYPLFLLGAPLCAALCETSKHRWAKQIYAGAAVANLLALGLTYMRSGWLGMAASLGYLLMVRRSPWTVHPKRRVLGIVFLVCILLATLLVRTNGKLMGNAHDRSTLGRFQIWRVSLHLIEIHPWLGSGLATYKRGQDQQMTTALQAFNPQNGEAKSLYLNIAVEFGFVGICLLIWVAYQYTRCYRFTIIRLACQSETAALLVSITAGGIGVVVAGFADTPILESYRRPATFVLALLIGAMAAFARDTMPAPASALGQSTCALTLRQPNCAIRPWYRKWKLLILALAILTTWVGLYLWAADTVNRSIVADSIPISDVSPVLLDATVAMEDGHYYSHGAFDWEAIHRALRINLRHGRIVQGGSTITQQVAKNLFLTNDRTLWRKAQEAFLANALEHRWSKRQLLEMYINTVEYGMGQKSIRSASRFYFHREPTRLTLAESAVLVGLVPYNPKQWPSRANLEHGRQIALDRIAYWFPNRYSIQDLDVARKIPLETLLPDLPRPYSVVEKKGQ